MLSESKQNHIVKCHQLGKNVRVILGKPFCWEELIVYSLNDSYNHAMVNSDMFSSFNSFGCILFVYIVLYIQYS